MVLARVKLTSGREVKLMELFMQSTYGGVLEGYPQADMNDRIVKRQPQQANLRYPDQPVCVVEPPRTTLDDDGQTRPFGPPELIPPVICTGFFSSDPVNPVLDLSLLVVVWFQGDTAVPAGSDAPQALRDIRWEALARDGEF